MFIFFMGYLMTQYQDYIVLDDSMTDELERIWPKQGAILAEQLRKIIETLRMTSLIIINKTLHRKCTQTGSLIQTPVFWVVTPYSLVCRRILFSHFPPAETLKMAVFSHN
jgi:hypothetical protein